MNTGTLSFINFHILYHQKSFQAYFLVVAIHNILSKLFLQEEHALPHLNSLSL